MKQTSKTPLAIALCLVASAGAARADVPAQIGSGNLHLTKAGKADAQLQAIVAAGAKMVRVPGDPASFWDAQTQRATPEKWDETILEAHKYGLTPMLLFEFYTRHHLKAMSLEEFGQREVWSKIGQAFAERYSPNSAWLKAKGISDWGITFYSAINEPMWKGNNPIAIPTDSYVNALEGLADGVHAVNAELRVSPGGYQESPLFMNKNPYVKAVAPLYNNGKLYALDIHRYWDDRHVPMQESRKYSLQTQFDAVKKNAGIAADIKFYTTEFNYKRSQSGQLLPDEMVASRFLTALWDALGVAGNAGEPVTQFVMPWNLTSLRDRDQNYGMTRQLQPWLPGARGETLRLVTGLTPGLEIVRSSRATGELMLRGPGRTMWVWHNRAGWADKPGAEYAIKDVPATASEILVYGWNGLRKTVATEGKTSVTIGDLAPDETYMFLAYAAG